MISLDGLEPGLGDEVEVNLEPAADPVEEVDENLESELNTVGVDVNLEPEPEPAEEVSENLMLLNPIPEPADAPERVELDDPLPEMLEAPEKEACSRESPAVVP